VVEHKDRKKRLREKKAYALVLMSHDSILE